MTSWRDDVQAALDRGERFAAAWASGDSWRAAFASPSGTRVLSVASRTPESIVDLVGAAAWDEREAHDLYGFDFDGHRPLRPLVDHPADGWMTPVSGSGVHEVAVGPIHAGVIESGHFRFHTVGDRVLALDARLFYKHRGLEKAAAGRAHDAALPYAQRACAACTVANGVAYAHAVEDALGLQPDRDLRVARTVLLELERLYNHLHDIGQLCAGVGLAAGTMAYAALKERAQRLNAELTGHRFLFGTVKVGRSDVTLDEDATRERLRDLAVDARAAWRDLEFAASLQARLDGVGVLGKEDALRLGTVGPAARASGVREDLRQHSPRLWYGGFTPARPLVETGDVAARLQLRAAELDASFDLLDELLGGTIAPGAATRGGATTSEDAERRGPQIGVGRVESPRGATTCAVELDRGTVTRLHLRTGSYANWPSVARAAAGCLLPDFPLINKSFELCYACVDR